MTLNDLVSSQTPVEVAEGFQFTEGPVWHPDGYLLFSDIPADTIYSYAPGGVPEPCISPSGNSNGLTFDREGNLVACEHGGRRVSRRGASGSMETVVDRHNGKPLNSPNDIVVHSSGAIFFTDPPYGIDPDPGEQGFNGVYRADTDGSITLLSQSMNRPNGLALSIDESVLYVDDSRNRHVLAYPLDAGLGVGEPCVLVDMDVEAQGGPDGMKLDSQGNLYVTGPGGLWVVTPEGEHLGTVEFPQLPANLCFGGPDLSTIYVTARTGLYSIQANVPGMPVF
ncbi:MAG: SMP-30/gluconolactonase/LRE family protein [Chloroflexota bacterium]|nr:SMP-30/gluconolactonase/LRE family protein [Chloroflexota bacterium]